MMSLRGWTLLMMVGGGIFEFLGIVLVAIDLRETRRRVHDFQQRGRVVKVGAAIELSSSGHASVSGGHTPSIEERLAALEAKVDAFPDQLQETRAQLVHRVMEEVSEAERRVLETASERDAAIEALVFGLSVQGQGRRVFGLVMLLLGLALAVIGNACL